LSIGNRTIRPGPYLCVVPDFGIHPDELARLEGMNPSNEAEIAMLIVSEAELAANGRWGGHPEPSRWIPRPVRPTE
jgi:hypothetical protein